MIEAGSFVEAARARGYTRYSGVPCSFLTPFINYVINDRKLKYISSANEGDALATAAGSVIGGQRAVVMMQNSGLGNAVSPITSLTYTFRIPVLIITTHRGAPEVSDEPQHELMGRITTDLFDRMQVPWEGFPDREATISDVLDRATAYLQNEHRPYALVMKKGSVAPHDLAGAAPGPVNERETVVNYRNDGPGPAPSRSAALQRIIERTSTDNTVVIATTGFTGRELYAIADRANQLYMVGSMGCASSLGLGLSLVRPDLHIVVIDGDGAALMRMGNFATLGAYAGGNLTHILLDNGVHDSTGAQATVSAGVDFAAIAAACGYGMAWSGHRVEVLDELFAAPAASGPRFAHLQTLPGTMEKLPRPAISPPEVLSRLMQHIGSRF